MNNRSRTEITKEKYLTEEEHEALIATLQPLYRSGHRDALMVVLALKTGARASELRAITKADIGHREKSVFIRGLKGSSNREIPLADDIYEALAKYAEGVKTERVFPIAPRTLHRSWVKFGIKKKFHALRHTFAINVYKRGRDIHLVRKLLGHSSINNTMVYLEYVETTERAREVLVG